VAPTLSQNGKSKRFGSILSRIERLLSQQLTPSSVVRSRADKRLASACVRLADRETFHSSRRMRQDQNHSGLLISLVQFDAACGRARQGPL
jgi:hypothetical protein